MDDIRLPSLTKPGRKKKESQAHGLYSRKGRLEMGNGNANDVLPISMDAEAMQKLLEELLLRENRERLEEEIDVNATLPIQSLNGLPQ